MIDKCCCDSGHDHNTVDVNLGWSFVCSACQAPNFFLMEPAASTSDEDVYSESLLDEAGAWKDTPHIVDVHYTTGSTHVMCVKCATVFRARYKQGDTVLYESGPNEDM